MEQSEAFVDDEVLLQALEQCELEDKQQHPMHGRSQTLTKEKKDKQLNRYVSTEKQRENKENNSQHEAIQNSKPPLPMRSKSVSEVNYPRREITKEIVRLNNQLSKSYEDIIQAQYCSFASCVGEQEVSVCIVWDMKEASTLRLSFARALSQEMEQCSSGEHSKRFMTYHFPIVHRICSFLGIFGEFNSRKLREWIKFSQLCPQWCHEIRTVHREAMVRTLIQKVLDDPRIVKVCYDLNSEAQFLAELQGYGLDRVWDIATLHEFSSLNERIARNRQYQEILSHWLHESATLLQTRNMHQSEICASLSAVRTCEQWLQNCTRGHKELKRKGSKPRPKSKKLNSHILDGATQYVGPGAKPYSVPCDCSSCRRSLIALLPTLGSTRPQAPSLTLDAYSIFGCLWPLLSDLRNNHKMEYFCKSTGRVLAALADIRRRGILVDRQKLFTYYKLTEETLCSISSELQQSRKQKLNLLSPVCIAELLSSELSSNCLPGSVQRLLDDYKKTRSINVAQKLASKEALNSLGENAQSRTAALILKYRQAVSWKYVLDGLVDAVGLQHTIHTAFAIHGTTGRIQSLSPSLQSFPQRVELHVCERRTMEEITASYGSLALSTTPQTECTLVRILSLTRRGVLVEPVSHGEQQRGYDSTYPAQEVSKDQVLPLSVPSDRSLGVGISSIYEHSCVSACNPFLSEEGRLYLNTRSLFVPHEGFVFLTADFRQIELRVLAHLSQDNNLSDLLQDKRMDTIIRIASRWLQKDVNEITDTGRSQTKSIVYGICYGMGISQLAQKLALSVESAKELHDSFHQTFPGIRRFMRSACQLCRERGYCVTLMGNRRKIIGITSNNTEERKRAERQAINTICQGSAADIFKETMLAVRCDTELRDAHIVLPVHDELLMEVPVANALQYSQRIKHCMETAVELRVPLPVKVSVGPSWGELSELSLPYASE
eukprot:gb/GECG01012014.1/.p1 GENE.gb/GECG01012014.1/~~gb/GECG01012014.1/.p1  ORF type:complete len:946 (+),score=72.65 gb/GECG01012014.1/:1-2838(+)